MAALWPVALREDLRRAVRDEGLRKIELWTARHGIGIADWPAEPIDPFFNVNTPEDAARAETIAARLFARLTGVIGAAPSAARGTPRGAWFQNSRWRRGTPA